MFMERWAWVCSSPQAISQSLYLVTVPKRELTAIFKKKKKKKRHSIELFGFAKLEQDFGLWFSCLLRL